MTDIEYKKLSEECRKNNKLYYTYSNNDMLDFLIQIFCFDMCTGINLPKVLTNVICNYAYDCKYLLESVYMPKITRGVTSAYMHYKNYFISYTFPTIQIMSLITKIVVYEYKIKHLTDARVQEIFCANIFIKNYFLIDNDSNIILYNNHEMILKIVVDKNNNFLFVPLYPVDNENILHSFTNGFNDYGFISLSMGHAFYETRIQDVVFVEEIYKDYVVTISTPHVEKIFNADLNFNLENIPDLKLRIRSNNYSINFYDVTTTISLSENMHSHRDLLYRIKNDTISIIFINDESFRYISFEIPTMKRFKIISENDINNFMCSWLDNALRVTSSTDVDLRILSSFISFTYVDWYCDDQHVYVICSLDGKFKIESEKTYILVKIYLFDKSNKMTFHSFKIHFEKSMPLFGNPNCFRIIDDKIYFNNKNGIYLSYSKHVV